MRFNTTNTLVHHLAVAIGSVLVALLLLALGYRVGRVMAAIPYFLLFLVMLIGPAVRIWPSISDWAEGSFPVNWRAELGIWFAIWSVVHVLFVWSARDWDVLGYLRDMSPWAFGAFVAVIIAIVLAFTSNTPALKFLGPRAWKWHQSHGSYVILWLTLVHIYDRAYLRPLGDVGFPSTDPLHWVYLIMAIIVVILHLAAFVKIVGHYRREGEYPAGL